MGDRVRRGWRVTAVAAALVITVAVGCRMLAPAEVLTPARGTYPVAVASPRPRVIGTLTAAPLIVDGRLRVYATTHQVRADRPVDARTVRTPYWSYRRWPAQVSGVVAERTTVVTRWSDGELVALDARTGRIVWRTAGPEPRHGYEGRRTGAATIYAPSGLYTGTTRDGRPVLVVSEHSDLRGFRLATGRELWRIELPCRGGGFTTTTGSFAAVCGSPPTVAFLDLATGTVTGRWRPGPAAPDVEVVPVGCTIGRSGCPAMRTTSAASATSASGAGGSRGWLLTGPGPVAAPALDPPGTELVNAIALQVRTGTRLVGRSARTGAQLWHVDFSGAIRILAVQPGRVHLLIAEHELATLDPVTGEQLSRFPFRYGRDGTDWATGYVHASSGLLMVERLAQPVDRNADDARYYLSLQPVVLAAT